MRYLLFFCLTIVAVPCAAADWITAPGEFTHDPRTGKPVQQYTPIGPVYAPNRRADYVTSGFRYTQDSLQIGRGSFDRLHLTEEWGNPVRPYGEWQYPYRPYSVPYAAWGPPYGGLGYGGWQPYYGGPVGQPGYGPYPGNGPGAGWGNGGGPGWQHSQGPGQLGYGPGLGNGFGGGPQAEPPYQSSPLNRGNWDRPPSSGIGGT